MEQIVDNYLDNAMSVSAPGETIEVRLETDTHSSTLHVLDRGPGMSAEGLERAFDRFWQGRSDGTGSGLGLSIVRQLAQASGAEVAVRNRGGGGLDASVRFGTEWTPERRSPGRRSARGRSASRRARGNDGAAGGAA